MNKLVTDGASGPTASEHGLIPVQPLLTDFAMSRFNREQHRLPITTSSSDTHERSIAKRLIQKQEAPLSAQEWLVLLRLAMVALALAAGAPRDGQHCSPIVPPSLLIPLKGERASWSPTARQSYPPNPGRAETRPFPNEHRQTELVRPGARLGDGIQRIRDFDSCEPRSASR